MAPLGSCCGNLPFGPINPISLILKVYNKSKSFFSSSSSSNSGGSSGKGSSGSGGIMLSNDDGAATGDQSLIRSADRSDSQDVPWIEVSDAVNAATGIASASMKGPAVKKNGSGNPAKAFKKGMKDAQKVNKYGETLVGSINNGNKDPDTTFTTTRAAGIETKVVSEIEVISFGAVENIQVTVPRSKVDSVLNSSKQSLDQQLKNMDNANNNLLKLLRNGNNN